MPTGRLPLPILAAVAACMLGGCGTMGSVSIKHERPHNNQAIHQTTGEQLLLNLVRLHHHELPTFLNIAYVNGGLNAGVTVSTPGLRIPFPVGGPYAAISSLSYEDNPTTSYKPLEGAELVAQLNSPISVKSLVDMHYSGWTLTPLMALIVERLAEGHQDHENAKNEIRALRSVEALVIEAAQENEGGDISRTNGGNVNVLTLYFSTKGEYTGDPKCLPGVDNPLGVKRYAVSHWLNLLKIYRPQDIRGVTAASVASASPAELNRIILKLPNTIDIYATSGRGRNVKRKAPILRTRSGLGVMKYLAEQMTNYVSPEEASEIINNHNRGTCPSRDYYLTKEDKRFYLLIQFSDTPPTSAFIVAYKDGKYYFINDDVSKRTLALLTLITTVQAIPGPSTVPIPMLKITR